MPIEISDLITFSHPNKEHNDEAVRRLAVHGSYYAVYNYFLDYAINNWGFNPKEKVIDYNNSTREIYGSHEKLGQFIRNYGIKNGAPDIVVLGEHLRNYHNLRCTADYKLHGKVTLSDARNHVNHCVRDLNKFHANVPQE